MKVYRKVSVTREVEELQEMKCDICGRSRISEDWSEKNFEVVHVEIRMEIGDSYPEGGEKTVTEYHICPGCFHDKVMPALRTLGAEPTVSEVNW